MLAEAAKDRQPVLRQNRLGSSITKRINHADALRQDIGSLRRDYTTASLAPVEGSVVLDGVEKYAFTQLQKHSNSFDCPDCLCGASLVSDGEVL